ncbi:MAG TPA: hypothetical protein VKP60_17365, partial [Magnetospirillaceae bacterium]|nr:hypothetical protein [Magnetospirillaceae bacterium]
MLRLSFPAIRLILFCLAPLVCGSLALVYGMDGSWDLRNYHYYNGWALLHGHVGRDMLVSQVPSFYNPLIDVPFAWAAGIMSARLIAFLLGMLHGADFILLTLLGEELLAEQEPRRRFWLAALLAAAGCAGAVALSEIGTVFYDNVTSLGLIGSLLLLARRWDRIVAGSRREAFIAGLPIGLAFGLKQTMVPFLCGIGLALLLTLPASWPKRIGATFWFGLGALAMTILAGGYWMAHLGNAYGNPLFPYFNEIFQSPWGQAGDYRDVYYQPKDLLHWLFFPVYFTFDSRVAAEVPFFDARVLALFVLIPAGALLGAFRKPRNALLLATIAIAYVAWLKLFSIYRYLVVLEMLAPLAILLISEALPPRRGRLIGLGIVLILCASTRPANWIRFPFTDQAVEVSAPRINDPDNTLVVLAGHEPLSFLIPAFPEG